MRGWIPSPSDPKIRTVLEEYLNSKRLLADASSRDATISNLPSLNFSTASARLETRMRGMISLAPELALAATGVRSEPRFFDQQTPLAPRHSAERMRAPKFCGSKI